MLRSASPRFASPRSLLRYKEPSEPGPPAESGFLRRRTGPAAAAAAPESQARARRSLLPGARGRGLTVDLPSLSRKALEMPL